MTRALHVTCLSIALAAATATAAQAKPAIAVLGLEVSDNGADQQSTAAASNLTVALRDRVRSGTGPYDTAGGSDKELIDLKLLNECSSEATPCMAKIGGDLGAKYMLYGHVAKANGTYHVSMVLFNVDAKSKVKSESFDVPVADLATGPKSKETLVWARKIYGELTGESSQGTVTVRVTGADHGTLLVEENGQWQPKGSITSNQGHTTLPEGKYRIAVESEGFQRFEATITVTSGGETSVPVALVPMPHVDTGTPVGPGSDTTGTGSAGVDIHQYGGTISDNDGNGWHKAFVGSAITTGVLAVGFGVSWAELSKTGKVPNTTFDYGQNCPMHAKLTSADNCSYGAALKDTAFVTGIGAVAVGSFAIIAMFESHRSSPSASGEHAGLGHRARRQFAVTPVVTPNTAGASFRIDW